MMETMKTRKLLGNAIIIAGVVLMVLSTSFVSGFLSGFLGKSIALHESLFLGSSIFSWGVTLLVAGDIIKMYRNRMTKKTKLLLLIPCSIYLLLLMITVIFPPQRICTIPSCSSAATVLSVLLIVASIVFWGCLLGGLYRMHREAKILDKMTKS